MWLCEDRSKGKTTHFRLPSASQKRSQMKVFLDEFLNNIWHARATILNPMGKVTLFNVGSSFSYEAGISGSRRCALYPLPLSVVCFKEI